MKKSLVKNKLLIGLFFPILIFLVSQVNLRYLFRSGIWQGHDLECHLARIANFYLAVKDGHFPVRWARNLNFKFGYPVFNYNYPLADMLAYPLIVVGFSIETTLKIILFSAYFLGGLFFYLWLKKHFSKLAAFTGAVFYLCTPYQFLDLFVRGSIGETLSFLFFPLICYWLKLLSEKITKWRFLCLIIATFLFALSHNIMVLVFTPLIFSYWFYLTKFSKLKLFLKTSLLGIVFGFMLSSFFWLPAYFEKNFVNLNAYDLKTFFQDHFVNFRQLIYSPWQYGFSVAGPNDTMIFQIGIFHLLVFFFALFLLIFSYFRRGRVSFKKNNLRLVLVLGLFIFSIFMMLPISFWLWKIIPLIGFVQFPWRFLSVAMITSSIIAGYVTQKSKIIGLILAGLCLIYCQQFTRPFSWQKYSDMYYYDYLFTTSIRHENMPRWFLENKSDQFKPRLTSDSGEVNFKELTWKTGKHVYEVSVPKETKIWEHTAYFPGWQGYIDGKKTEVLYDNKDYPGIIGLNIPAGKHQVVVRFTENTLARIIGDSLSAITLLLIIISFIKFIRN